MNAFVYLGDPASCSTSSFSSFFGSFVNLFSVPAGHAIIDPGAAQDLIGTKHFETLQEKEVGLRTIELNEEPASACGVGGNAKAVKVVLCPCALGGQPGVVRLVVMTVRLRIFCRSACSEHAGSNIDVFSGKITFKNFGAEAQMGRLPSGHRILNIAQWEGGQFPAPDEAKNI